MKTKRYFILMNTERATFEARCNSLKIAEWLMNLRFWKYAKIHDIQDEHKCIAFVNRK